MAELSRSRARLRAAVAATLVSALFATTIIVVRARSRLGRAHDERSLACELGLVFAVALGLSCARVCGATHARFFADGVLVALA